MHSRDELPHAEVCCLSDRLHLAGKEREHREACGHELRILSWLKALPVVSAQHLEACGALGTGAELVVGLQRLQAARDGATVRAWPAVWCLTLAASVTVSVVRSWL